MTVKDDAIATGWTFAKRELERQIKRKDAEMLNAVSRLITALNGSSINTNVTVPDNNITINGSFDSKSVADAISHKLEEK